MEPPAKAQPTEAPFERETGFLWLTVLLGTVLFGAMRQLNGALASRHPPGEVGRGVLDFPWLFSGSPIETVRAAVTAWYDAKPDERFADGAALADRVVALDFAFIAAYAIAGAILLNRAKAGSSGTERFAPVADTVLLWARRLLVALVAVDVAEDVLALAVVHAEWGRNASAPDIAIGALALLTTVKLLLAPLVVIPLVLASIRLPSPRERAVGKRVRIVAVALAAFAVLLLFGIGGEQSAEVIRSWGFREAVLALIAVAVLACGTWGAVRVMTAHIEIAARPGGGDGDEPYRELAIAGAVLLVLGVVAATALEGWSAALAVPGALLLAIVGLSLPIKSVAADPTVELERDELAARKAEDERLGRMWARALAAAALFLPGFAALRAAAFEMLGRGALIGPLETWAFPVGFGCLCLAGGVAFMLVPGRSRSAFAVAALGCGCLTVLAALVLFLSPLEVGAWLGAMAVIALFFAALIGVLLLLTWAGTAAGDRYRLPAALAVLGFNRFPTLLFVALWFVLASVIPFVDRAGYHDVRLADGEGEVDVSFETAWKRWAGRNLVGPETEQGEPRRGVPLIIVAASGGGIRAAAWTSLALDCIFERLPAEDMGAKTHCPADGSWARTGSTSASDRLFAASGTSGGSLGLVEYDAYLRNKATGAAEAGNWVAERLDDDFVAPTVAGMLFRDLPRAFTGFDASDRASLLEQAWEDPWDGERAKLDRGLRATWDAEAEGEPLRPLLLLTGTGVEDRCRFMTSVLDANVQPTTAPGDDDCLRLDAYGPRAASTATRSGILPAATELTDLLCPTEDVRMSTAALLSARFAFVSPSGRIKAKDCAPVEGDAVTYVVDGGYFDNSGAVAPRDLWRVLEPRIAKQNAGTGRCIVPVYVQLDNDFEAEPSPGPDARPLELLVPPKVIFGGIGSHETAARAEAAATFDWPSVLSGVRVFGGGENLKHLWVRLAPRAHPGPQPPLGWTLSDSSFTDMRHELAAKYNQPALDVLAGALSDDLTCN